MSSILLPQSFEEPPSYKPSNTSTIVTRRRSLPASKEKSSGDSWNHKSKLAPIPAHPLLLMKTTASQSPRPAFGLLLVGAPKSGKTSFALQFPNPYIADCDNNISGPHRYLKEKSLSPVFSYDTIDIADDGTEVAIGKRWTRLTECCKVAAASKDIDTIIVDSLTKVSDYLVDHILNYEKIQQMRIQDWLSYQNLMKRFVTYLRSTGKLVIFCAHETVEKDELEGTLKYFIALPSKLRDTIGGLFTDVWRAEYQPGAAGKEGAYMVRAVSSARMSLGNSLGLPAAFPMEYKQIQPKLTSL